VKRKAIPLVLKFGIFVSIVCLPGFLLGQSAGTIHPPALGFVFDSGTLRPILGIPGASLLGAPLDMGLETVGAAISPSQDYALLLARHHHEVELLRLDQSAAASPISGAMAAPDLMVLSPTGSAAILYRTNDGLLQVLTGLPDSPQILREIPCASLGTLTSVAVADDGQTVLAAAANNLVLIPADGIPRPLPLDGPVSAMAFRPRTHDAIVAIAQNNQVSLILHTADIPQIQLLAGPDDGILQPLAVAFSLDGLRALIANSGGNLVQLDLSGAPPQSFSCQCKIAGLHRLAGSSVFRLTDPSGGPLIVFDGDAPQPRILFVPAAPKGGITDVR
jgi:hypothetical protein